MGLRVRVQGGKGVESVGGRALPGVVALFVWLSVLLIVLFVAGIVFYESDYC